ncbi:MAG: hypothetical protein ACJ8GJ_18345 [Vitreoscilla sp.]
MAETSTALYRSVTSDAFPDGVVKDGVPAAGLLYPDFYARTLPDGKVRDPDVVVFRDTRGDEWVQDLGGTSLFDKANVFKGKRWLSFEIPEGTVIPDSLVIRDTGFNKRFQATHYQIESAAKTMRMDSYKGALDNLARNAIVRSLAAAKSH